MELPIEWYSYVIPGVVCLVAIGLTRGNRAKEYFDKMDLSTKFLFGLLLLIFSYPIGVGLDAGVNIIHYPFSGPPTPPYDKEFLLYQFASPALVKAVTGGYIYVLFLRSMSAAVAILFIVLLFNLRRIELTGWRKIALPVILFLVSCLFFIQYERQMSSYAKFQDTVYKNLENHLTK